MSSTEIKGNYKESVWENWSSAICFSQIGKSRLSCLPHAAFSIIFWEFSISIPDIYSMKLVEREIHCHHQLLKKPPHEVMQTISTKTAIFFTQKEDLVCEKICKKI